MIAAIVTLGLIVACVAGGAVVGWAINIPEPDSGIYFRPADPGSPAHVHQMCRYRAARYMQDAA